MNTPLYQAILGREVSCNYKSTDGTKLIIIGPIVAVWMYDNTPRVIIAPRADYFGTFVEAKLRDCYVEDTTEDDGIILGWDGVAVQEEDDDAA